MLTTRKRSYSRTEQGSSKQQDDVTVKTEPGYDFLLGNTPLHSFYLGLLAGASCHDQVIHLHALSLPFLLRLLQQCRTDRITPRCALINGRARWVVDDEALTDRLALVGWRNGRFDSTVMTSFFHNAKPLLLTFFLGWLASEDHGRTILHATDMAPLETMQSLLTSVGFVCKLRLITMPATATENPTAQYQLDIPHEPNKKLFDQALDLVADLPYTLDIGSTPVLTSQPLHRQVARDFEDQPLVKINAMLTMAGMSPLHTHQLNIAAFIAAIRTSTTSNDSTTLLSSYLLCYEYDNINIQDVQPHQPIRLTVNLKKPCPQRVATKPHRMFPCLIQGCDKKYSFKGGRSKHIKEHHEQRDRVTCTYDGCDEAFSRKETMLQHIRTFHEHQRVPCSFQGCDKTFTTKSSMRTHAQTVHERTKFPCPICHKRFNWRTSLGEHIKAIHQDPQFACRHPGCNMVFRRAKPLNTHIKACHKLPQFACPIQGCRKVYWLKMYLHHHVHDHQVACPFEGCSADFSPQ